MQLRRQFYDFLLKWRENKRRECLLVKGARQIGKTYIIEQFGREQYESSVTINFLDRPEYMEVFKRNLDAETIKTGITVIDPSVRFPAGKTLIFLDEIQECPAARTALKFLAMDETIDVIASGSLLGLKYKKGRKRKPPKSIAVGYERQVEMHSLSFREYLWAKGYDDDFISSVKAEESSSEENPNLPSAVRRYTRSPDGLDTVTYSARVAQFNEFENFSYYNKPTVDLIGATPVVIQSVGRRAS